MSIENLSVLIPFRDGHATIDRLLDSLGVDVCIIVIDDQSERALVTDRPNMRVVRPPTRGYFSGAVNEGLAACDTDVLILNQDVWLENDLGLERSAFGKLIQEKRNEFAIIGDGVFNHPAWANGYCQGTAMFVRRDCIQRVGNFNKEFYPLWGATAELQLRACRLGFKALPVRMAEYGMQHARGDKPYGSSIAATLQSEPDKQKLLIRTPPLISVVITSYNYGRYLNDAVHSLIGGKTSLGEFPPQTFQSFEIILVDDGSTDDTRAICESFADDWKAIHFISRKTKGGSSAAANTGIATAYGKYVTVLDADDMMESTRLEKMVRLAEQNPHRVIYDGVMRFKEGKRSEVFPISKNYDFEKTLSHNQMHKGILYERAAWKEVGGYPETMKDGREDWGINVALGAKGYCGIHLDEPLYLYRREGQNRTLKNNTAWHRNFFVDQMHRLYPNLYAGERPMGCCGNGRTKSNGNGVGAMAATRGGRMMGAFNTMPGQNGFAQVEYLLNRAGTKQYYGAVTHTVYVFGGQRKIGYVDARDVNALLDLMEGHQHAFRLYQPPAPKPEPIAVEIAQVTPELNAAEIPLDDPQQVEVETKNLETPTETVPVKSKTSSARKAKKAAA